MSSLVPSVEVFDPAVPIVEQAGKISGLGEKSLPPEIMSVFGLPQLILMSPGEDILKWESPLCAEQVWREFYFLLRCGVVIHAGDLPTLGDMSLTLAMAKMAGIPIITVSDRVTLPAQIKYISDIVVGSDISKLLPIVKMYLQAR
jgi:hypothetical protein